MATLTESFGAVPVKVSRRMERLHGNKRRALLLGFPSETREKTCCGLEQDVENGPPRETGEDRLQRDSESESTGDISERRRNRSVSRQLSSHVFTEWSLTFLLTVSIFAAYLVRPLSGLHPPQCHWSLYQDIERLNCLVDPGNSLIVEEEVHGVGPERAKSLWVQCSGGSSFYSDNSPTSGSRPDETFYPSSSALGTEGVQTNANSGGDFVLSHGVFMAVPNLRDLRLENCKISGITPGSLGYLPYLQNLTIRAHTSLNSWPLSSSLEINSGVLRGLSQLRYLDLSSTRTLLPGEDFVCSLPPSLQFLNLTNCWLRDFRSIGIVPSDPTNPQKCGTAIRTLDLSENHFTLLPPATFAALGQLEELRIEKNSITIASERALLGLTSLKIISLAGNQLTSLPPEFFKDNNNLQEIHLQNNSLSVLAPGLFGGLKNLAVLDLSNNELTSEWVNGDIFTNLFNLFSLNLASNGLTKLDSVLFKDLRFLQMLNLENNKISYIAEDSFSAMVNLYTLVLSRNHVKKIAPFICNNLRGLAYLSLDSQVHGLDSVEPNSFNNCSNVHDINISGNKLRAIPEALSVLTNLRTVDLGENQIVDVGNLSFPYLYGMRLTDNKIEKIANSFENLPSLKIINLAKNNISFIAPGVFDNNSNLQAIRLDSNRLTNITNLVKNVPNLLWLNISANHLEELKYEEFPQRLQWLDLRSNKIHTLGNCMDLDNLKIRNLDVSHNQITEISSSNLPDSIVNLIISHNPVHSVHPYTFYRKPNLTFVDLTHGKLTHLDQNALRLDMTRASAVSVAEIYLGHNPFQCDCSMQWLQSIDSAVTAGQYPVIKDVSDVKCTMSFDRSYEPISYLSVQPSQFLCKYESHCFNTCQCCEYDACDCKMACPKNCSCYHDQAWSTNVVDCSMLEQSFIPGPIPMDTTELYLDGNVFTSLDSHSFIGLKVKTLYLNASNIQSIQNRAFRGLKSLKKLYLQNNFIERLQGYEFDDLDLEELYLQQNSISWIANETFSKLYNLKVLWLHGNNLVDLPIWQVTTHIGRLGHTLSEITLRGNEWSCECQFASQLKDWLIENRAKISDANQVQCVDQVSTYSSPVSSGNSQLGSGSGSESPRSIGQSTKSQTELVVVRLMDQKNHRCTSSSPSQSTDLSILEPTKSTDSEPSGFSMAEYGPWLVCIPGVLILLILLSVLTYYWRQSLRVWFHSQCGLRLGSCRESPAERDKLFDAFVSYSSKDEAWVRQVLAAELERNDPPYRLCLRYRDLPTGGTYLADSIVQASAASRRVLLIISHHWLKGEWSRTDVKSAHHSILKDRHRKVIIILLGDLPSKDLDPDIRLYLKNHTYINCDDKKFWEKLRYALPDVKVKVPVFRGIHGRTPSARNNSQHCGNSGSTTTSPVSAAPLQPPSHHHLHHAQAHHHHYNQPSPNMSQAHHLTHLGPSAQNNITSPLIGPPPPLTAPPVPGLLANLPPNIPNGTMGHSGHHPLHGPLHTGGGPVTTVIGAGLHGGSTASISTSSNNSGSQRAAQRHHNLVNSAQQHHQPHPHANGRNNTAIHI